MTFCGLTPVGAVIIERKGCCHVKHLYFTGIHPELHVYGEIEYVEGLTGDETRLTVHAMLATHVVEVRDGKS